MTTPHELIILNIELSVQLEFPRHYTRYIKAICSHPEISMMMVGDYIVFG